MSASADLHDVWKTHLPLGISCNHCLHRALIPRERVGAREGDLRCVDTLRFRCTKCGRRNVHGSSLQGAAARQGLHGGVPLMDQPKERVFHGYLSSADVERLYPARVARIARGELTYADRGRINEEVSSIDREWRGGGFNGIEYFHFRFPEQGARMAAFLMKQRLHRLVPGSSRAPTPEEVDAGWARLAQEREAILSWARSTRMLIEIVQTYRFERRQGAFPRRPMLPRRSWSRRWIRPSATR